MGYTGKVKKPRSMEMKEEFDKKEKDRRLMKRSTDYVKRMRAKYPDTRKKTSTADKPKAKAKAVKPSLVGKIKRTAKELVGGKKTYRKGKLETDLGKITRATRRAKNRVAKESGDLKGLTKQAKERRTRLGTSKTISGKLSYKDWMKKHGKGATAATSKQYRQYNK